MPEQSALVVPVPAAEPAVARWRRDLDPSARLGVAAHITIVSPFVAPEQIDEALLDELAGLIAQQPTFTVRLTAVGWFGDAVAYLRTESETPLRRLTRLVVERWPDHPPYGGAYDDAVPHLTIGQDAGVDVLRRAATAVERELPIHQRVESVHLLTGSDEEGSWETLRAFPLAAHVEGEATLRRP